MAVDLQAVRRVINPPHRITSLKHVRELITSEDCYSIIEEKFYDDIFPIFEDLHANRVRGDIVAAGIWRGGSALYLQALNHYFNLGKHLWLSDTFFGFRKDRIEHDKDREALEMFARLFGRHMTKAGSWAWTQQPLRWLRPPSRMPEFPKPRDIERLFRSCDLWGDDVTILEGPLEQTLPGLPDRPLSLVHIDVDLYEPTRRALELTYDKLSHGGYVIVDDYGADIYNCKEAVDDFREANDVQEPMTFMTEYAVFWRKS